MNSIISKENLLLIFTRNPELGKCKTRLAAAVGDESALKIYKFLLQHTASITKKVKATKQVWYSNEIWEDDLWNSSFYEKKLQHGADLGVRMASAFKEGFETGYKHIIIIGSDMYDLSSEDIDAAFITLENNDYVVGSAEDGGYYLLGMKKFNADIFQNKDWGTSSVLTETLSDLKNEKVFLSDTRNDIDFYEDIESVEAFQPFLKHMK